MLTLTLMSSENRAAFALSRVFPGGRTEFIRRMNLKAKLLGLHDTEFGDPTGLDPLNVSTATDLARMVRAAQRYPQIRTATTRTSATVRPYRGKKPLRYVNTNRLVRSDVWEIGLSKTGYVNEAGRCLVMMVDVKDEPIVVVLLNSYGKLTPIGDANRIRKWIEKGVTSASKMASVGNPPNT
jgi:D-alanyl-D-alanine endopeptidase (penicillin-binding protein 7)